MKSTPIAPKSIASFTAATTPFELTPFKSTFFNFTPFSSFVFIIIKVLSFVLIGMLVFSCSEEDDGIYFSETDTDILVNKVSFSDIDLDKLNLVNAHRKTRDLPELIRLNVISSVAYGHTEYMISEGEASHDNFPQRAQNLMANANAKTVGENVAYGFSTAQEVFNGWLKSSEHKKIIEDSSYTHFGILTDSDTEGRNYFTHILLVNNNLNSPTTSLPPTVVYFNINYIHV